MNGVEQDDSEFVEVDPTGRYGRYNEILGKGASKTVYRAFDEYEGIEVAWNQVKLFDVLQSPEDLERLYCEIHLLKTLKHKNIMKFYTSWVDTSKRHINFVTEMFTSGTLRQYRLKHKRVNIRAVKHWCRQILKGLLYLHSLDPPVIHRDLKCDNIFVNGHQGEVKIGDLGLAAILRNSHAAHCVGTPEFMAPEVYEEEYNELVDIYSFGMCVLEMVTFEYPYSECTHPAQIYKKVVSGKKPDAFYKVKDHEVREFVEKCLATASSRHSARELLNDPFLQIDDYESDLRPLKHRTDLDDINPNLRPPFLDYDHLNNGSLSNGYSNGVDYEAQNGWDDHLLESEQSGIELFEYQNDEHSANVDISIKGKRRDDDGIFLRLRIADKEGQVRNIYFPFDVESDTALIVATEMVAELDITEQDVNQIADMIDTEVASLVPEWKLEPGIEETETLPFENMTFCENCVSNHTSCGSLMDYLSVNPGSKNLQVQCSNGCAATHGRFEEITYKIDDKSENQVNVGTPVGSTHDKNSHNNESWFNHESIELSSLGSSVEQIDDAETEIIQEAAFQNERSSNGICSLKSAIDDYESVIQRELRWVKAKCQMELGKIKDQQVKNKGKSSRNCTKDSSVKNQSLYSGSLLPLSLRRTTSLPVDAVDL